MAYQQVTLGELQQLLAARRDASQYWVAAESTAAVNEALRWWNLFTGYWTTRWQLPTVAGQVWYTVPQTLAPVLHVRWGRYLLDLSSIVELDLTHPNWEAEQTNTGGIVPTRVMNFAPTGLTLLALWPADHQSGTPLLIDGVRNTPVLVEPSDTIDIGQEELQPILDEALHLLAFKEGGTRFAHTMALHTNFLRACASQNTRLLTSAQFRSQLGMDRARQEVLLTNSVTPPSPPYTDRANESEG